MPKFINKRRPKKRKMPPFNRGARVNSRIRVKARAANATAGTARLDTNSPFRRATSATAYPERAVVRCGNRKISHYYEDRPRARANR